MLASMLGVIFGATALIAGMELVNSLATVPADVRRERVALGAFLFSVAGLAAGVLSCL